jgi:uncharacterized protein YndB with AHSA1/START domain
MSYHVRLERVFDARPEIVFDALLDPAAQRALLADGPDWIVESELDLRVGGTWIVKFGPSPSELYREVAVFSEVDRPHRLVYTVTAIAKDKPTFDTQMEITFEFENGKTRMTLVQTGYSTATLRDSYESGWSGILDALAGVVAERTAGSNA